jgi:hypothetical protein
MARQVAFVAASIDLPEADPTICFPAKEQLLSIVSVSSLGQGKHRVLLDDPETAGLAPVATANGCASRERSGYDKERRKLLNR